MADLIKTLYATSAFVSEAGTSVEWYVRKKVHVFPIYSAGLHNLGEENMPDYKHFFQYCGAKVKDFRPTGLGSEIPNVIHVINPLLSEMKLLKSSIQKPHDGKAVEINLHYLKCATDNLWGILDIELVHELWLVN